MCPFPQEKGGHMVDHNLLSFVRLHDIRMSICAHLKCPVTITDGWTQTETQLNSSKSIRLQQDIAP